MSRDLILSEMDRIRKEVKRLSKSFLDLPRQRIGKPMLKASFGRPEIADNGKEIVAKINLPGMKMKDLKLNVKPQSVEIKAEHEDGSSVQKKGLFKKESSYRGFYRMFPLPVKVLADKSKTLYRNGVLEIHLPKAEAKKARK